MTSTAVIVRPRLVVAALLAVAAALALTGIGPRPAPARAAEVVSVDVTGFAFVPATVTIQVGDTIQWNNADPVDHTATSTSGPASFDVYLSAGAWGSHTFTVAGTYEYYCIPHPTMTGTIVVQAATSSPGGGSVPDVAMPGPHHPVAAGLATLALLALLLIGWLDVRRRRSQLLR